MTGTAVAAPRRWGWLVGAGAGALVAGAIGLGGLWALVETADTGSGSAWMVLTGAGSGLLFWGWIAAGCWRRAHEPEPDPYEPAPVPHSTAFVVANLVLAVLFTALVVGGLWAGVDSARDAERADLVRHRVGVAARAADLDRASLTAVFTTGGLEGVAALLPVVGAEVVAVATGDETASVLFRPDGGPPCVVLDIDADDLLSTRRTNRCS